MFCFLSTEYERQQCFLKICEEKLFHSVPSDCIKGAVDDDELTAGYGQISNGAETLASGSKELKLGSQNLYTGTQELLNGMLTLYDGTAELNEGTGTLRSETDGMDREISAQIDNLIGSISGGDREIISFVSDKNTNVEAVQFVIQTEGVHVEEIEEQTVEEAEEDSIWKKFIRLFGID